MTVAEIEAELARLTTAEKAELLGRLAVELAGVSPGIDSDPNTAGGAACIVRTRIPVWTLESYRRLGWTDAQILTNFPTLRASDLANAWTYVSAHGAEIERAIQDHEAA